MLPAPLVRVGSTRRSYASAGHLGGASPSPPRLSDQPRAGGPKFLPRLLRTRHLMSATLSVAGCLDFIACFDRAARIVARSLLDEAQVRGLTADTSPFLGDLIGATTPHNNPPAQAVFCMVPAPTGPMWRYADTGGRRPRTRAGHRPCGVHRDHGKKHQSHLARWSRKPSTGLNACLSLRQNLLCREDGEVGPSLGAAQLAWMAVDKASAANTCPAPPLLAAHEPDPARHAWLRERHERFARLYTQVEPSFSAPA